MRVTPGNPPQPSIARYADVDQSMEKLGGSRSTAAGFLQLDALRHREAKERRSSASASVCPPYVEGFISE